MWYFEFVRAQFRDHCNCYFLLSFVKVKFALVLAAVVFFVGKPQVAIFPQAGMIPAPVGPLGTPSDRPGRTLTSTPPRHIYYLYRHFPPPPLNVLYKLIYT